MRLLFLLLAWLAAVALLVPHEPFSLWDDWVYSWAAHRLAFGSALELPELSAAYPLFQIAWGAVFSRLGGGSELALRVSVLVLATAGNLAWYALLRARGFSARASWWALACVLFNPVYFVLAPSFMTDVVFVSLWQLSLACLLFCQGPGERSGLWILPAMLAALAAAMTRQPGAALIVGVAVAALAMGRRAAAACALALLGAGAFAQLAFTRQLGAGLPLTDRFAELSQVLTVSPGLYLEAAVVVAGFVGLAVAPAALAGGTVRPRWAVAAAAALAAGWLLWDAPLLREGAVWGACELGGQRSLLSGHPPGCQWALPLRILALGLSSLGLGALLPALWGRLRGLVGGHEDAYGQGVAAAVTVLALGMGLLWMFADRYWLVAVLVAPPLVLASGSGSPRQQPAARSRVRGLAAALLLSSYAAVAVAGYADAVDLYRRVNALADATVTRGAPAASIDAGYAVNARRRYLALEPARGGEGRNATVPWVTAVATSPYTVANRVEAGWRETGRLGDMVVVERLTAR